MTPVPLRSLKSGAKFVTVLAKLVGIVIQPMNVSPTLIERTGVEVSIDGPNDTILEMKLRPGLLVYKLPSGRRKRKRRPYTPKGGLSEYALHLPNGRRGGGSE